MVSEQEIDLAMMEMPMEEAPTEAEVVQESMAGPGILDFIGQQNIAQMLDDKTLEEIGATVMREFEIDDTNFTGRKNQIEDLYKLALQVAEHKNYPFEGASNIKYPILTKAALGFAAMAYPSIVKDDRVVKAKVVGSDEGQEPVMGPDGAPLVNPETGKPERKNAGLKAKAGERVSVFTSHQVLEEMDGWEDDTDKILHIIPIIGCAFKKVYRDPIEQTNISRLVLPQFLIINIDAKTVERANRVSELLELYPNEIRENINAGVFVDFDFTASSETLDDNYKDSEKRASDTVDSDSPHVFIEQHRYLDLDEDGYAEPYIVWVHKQTRTVARILPRFDESSIIFGSEGQIIKIKPDVCYVKYPFIPDPEGSVYDIGFGHLLQHLNAAVNTSVNQMIDQGHLYTVGGGFVGDGLRMKAGEMKFRPNEWKRVKSTGGAIRDNVFPLPVKEPSTVLFALLEFLVRAADEISAMTRILAGDMPANMPATTTLAIIEQGMQPFKAVFKRVHRALKREFKILFALNKKYTTQEEYARVLDDPSANVQRDFELGDIVPVSDPEMLNNTQALIRAQALSEYKDDPLFDGVEVRMRVLEAMNIRDPEKLVKIPPQSPDAVGEAQKAVLEATVMELQQRMKMAQAESDRKDLDMKIKLGKAIHEINKMIAETQKTKADAMLSLAKAEGEEQGQQLSLYELQLNHLMQVKESLNEKYTAYNDPGQLGGMENQPADG